MMNRQQLCAALGVSESTIRRLERIGLPFTPVGARSKRYDFDECKGWLRLHGATNPPALPGNSWTPSDEFAAACRKVKLRVMPSD